MAREKKTKASERQENTVSVDMAKLTEGINLVFSGAVKMLEALQPVNVSIALNSVNLPVLVLNWILLLIIRRKRRRKSHWKKIRRNPVTLLARSQPMTSQE